LGRVPAPAVRRKFFAHGLGGRANRKVLKPGELVTLKRAGFDGTEIHADIARAAIRFLLRD